MIIRKTFTIQLVIFLLIAIKQLDGAAVMSIDLGSEWMKVGVVSPGVPMEIALNKESKRKTPAVIAFRNDERTFGEDAQSIGVRFPANAFFYLSDLLGKTIDNPIVQQYRKRFPYYNITGDGERNTVVFNLENNIFRVEELVAQLLGKAREFAEDYTRQSITECVLVVPGYFGQAERVALLTAAKLVDLKVLQLINDYSAVALNYGVFRGKQINDTAEYYIFYDMGAQKTTASLISYQLVTDKITKERNPVVQVLGVGYDRNLGGLEIQIRLRDHLANEFNRMGKTKTDVRQNARAMAKLFKEAGRLKNVLSANVDHFAQIENLIEDHDFKLQVTREQLEEICKDLWPRIKIPLEQALSYSGLTMDVISQVVLFGGGTRVPKIQETLKELINQELGKNLNADEAAVMGAVYKAADLATGFKVKKFIVKDSVLFPIQVSFDRDTDDGGIRNIKRILFGLANVYPQKKVITFNKHTKDFNFNCNYAELNNLNEEEINRLGKLNLSRVEIKGVEDLLNKYSGDDIESKGIKAHFSVDDSGVFELKNVDFVFEKQQIEEEISTFSKLGSKLGELFSGTSSKAEEVKDEPQEVSHEVPDVDSSSSNTVNNNDTILNETEHLPINVTDNINQTTEQAEKTKKNDKKKIVTIKEPLKYVEEIIFVGRMSDTVFNESFKKLQMLQSIDLERSKREKAQNALESAIFEAQERLERDEYEICSTVDEKNNILSKCNTIRDWLEEESYNAKAIDFEEKLENLRELTNVIYARHWEHKERPEALKALTTMMEEATKFLDTAKNFTKDKDPEKDVFTNVELDMLEKTINDTITWKSNESDEQNKLKRSDPIRLTVKDITDKMSLLDREVKYLVNKIKIWKPKLKPTTKPVKGTINVNETTVNQTDTTTIQNETRKDADDHNQQDEMKIEEVLDIPDTDTNTELPPTTKSDKSEETDDKSHGEL